MHRFVNQRGEIKTRRRATPAASFKFCGQCATQDKHAAAAAKAGRSRQPANRCIIMGAGDLPLGAKIKVTHARDGHDCAACVEVAALCSFCTFHCQIPEVSISFQIIIFYPRLFRLKLD